MKLVKEERIAALKNFSRKIEIAKNTIDYVLSVYDGSEITGDIAPDEWFSFYSGEKKEKYSVGEVYSMIETKYDDNCTDPVYDIAMETISKFVSIYDENY